MIKLEIPGLSPGLRMRVHEQGDRMISERLRRDCCWEPYETFLTLQHLKPGDVYVDVGANIGYYTLIAAQRVGATGRVFAYEPDPDNLALLQDNVKLNEFSNVDIFSCAISDRNGRGELFLSTDNYGDHRIYSDDSARTRRAIQLVNGAEHLGQRTRRVDFLKIDTQGAEYFVIKGLWPLIEANRDHLSLVLEFCPYGIRHCGGDGLALVQLLAQTGLPLQIIDHQQECLIPAEPHHLSEWVLAMEQEPANEGFVNLLLSAKNPG